MSTGMDRIPALLIREEEILEEIRQLNIKVMRLTKEIMTVVDSVQDLDCADVLFYRHVQNWTVKQTAQHMNKSEKWVYEKQRKAFELLERDMLHEKEHDSTIT